MMRSLTSVLGFLCLATTAFGWGDEGHRVVGFIAQRHLTPEAAKKLAAIMNPDGKLGKPESLARAATWPDEIRSDPSLTDAQKDEFRSWHFVEIPIGKTYEESHHAGGKEDAYTALTQQEKVLSSASSSAEDKVKAVRWITHLVGDIHMPFHVGNALDAGANNCLVKWFSERSAPVKLHAVWDSKLIDELNLSYTELADFIDVRKPDEVRDLEQGSYLDWMKDSIEVREKAYPTPVAAAANGEIARATTIEGMRPYCSDDPKKNPIPEAAMPLLEYEYAFRMRPLLEQQLLKGGVRLAAVLNRILGR